MGAKKFVAITDEGEEGWLVGVSRVQDPGGRKNSAKTRKESERSPGKSREGRGRKMEELICQKHPKSLNGPSRDQPELNVGVPFTTTSSHYSELPLRTKVSVLELGGAELESSGYERVLSMLGV